MDDYFFVFKHFDGNSGMINHSMINQSNHDHGGHSVGAAGCVVE
jgi:hypothetical protein